MYKKIKNSSFMNIFWFILYLLPLIMIIVFSINFYRNDEITLNKPSVHIDNLWVSEFYVDSDDDFISYDVNGKYFYNALGEDYYGKINFDISNLYYSDLVLYFFVVNNGSSLAYLNIDNKGYFYSPFVDYIFVDLSQLDYEVSELSSFFIEIDTYYNNGNFRIYPLLMNYKINLSNIDLYNYYNHIEVVDNNSFDIEYNTNDYVIYLQDNFYNTFSHSGIIYNMFINLFSYFGVLNIYIKIISVYLEYIILISLIHLAVDILLLLPNICHKFMEKVGGERD